MAQTKDGALKHKQTMKEKYGADFYKRIGAIGGSRRVPKGFATNLELASRAGVIGGRMSPKKNVTSK